MARVNKEGEPEDSEEYIKQLLSASVFKDYIKKVEIIGSKSISEKLNDVKINESSFKKTVKVMTDHSAVVSGLKCMLQEAAPDIVCNLSEDYFNIDAKPFMPKPPSDPVQHSLQ